MSFAKYLAIAALVAFLSTNEAVAQNLIYVAKGYVVYEENGENRRLLIEPGTLLKFLHKKSVFPHGTLYRVRTPTGIVGVMRENDVLLFDHLPENVAFVKKMLIRPGIHLIPGEIIPYKKVDDLDETFFEMDVGIAKYIVKDKDYAIRHRKMKLSPQKFVEYFNVITQSDVNKTSFPIWRQMTKGGKKVLQTWGCGESSKVIDFLSAGAESEVGAGGTFWGWFSAKFSAYLKGGRDQTWTIEKKDEKHQHKLSFWNLEKEDGSVLLRLVIDRIRECPPAESNNINYEFSFPGNEIDSFEISHNWVKEWVNQNMYNYKGEVVPLTLVSLEDYRNLKEILTRSGYLKFDRHLPYVNHVRDQIIRISAAVLRPLE